MIKRFCDECEKEIGTSYCDTSFDIDNDEEERSTEVQFIIKGRVYDSNSDDYPKRHMIEILCKKCAIKFIKEALKQLEKE